MSCHHPDPRLLTHIACRECGVVKAPGRPLEYLSGEQLDAAMVTLLCCIEPGTPVKLSGAEPDEGPAS